MLPHYSPFKVAETFSLLAGLYPGRIDLGHRPRRGHRPDDHARPAARPPHGACPTTSRSSWPSCSPTTRTRIPAVEPALPAGQGAARAARRRRRSGCSAPRRRARCGRPISGCRTRSPTSSTRSGAEIARALPARVRRGAAAARPAHRGGRVGAVRGQRGGGAAALHQQPHDVHAAAPGPAHPRPAAGDRRALPRARRATALAGRRRTIVGTPDAVRAGIEAAAGEYGAEEVIVVTITYDHAARRRSYELIAEAFGLTPVPLAAAADAEHGAVGRGLSARQPPPARGRRGPRRSARQPIASSSARSCVASTSVPR